MIKINVVQPNGHLVQRNKFSQTLVIQTQKSIIGTISLLIIMV